MKYIKNNIYSFILISVLLQLGCNESATNSKQNNMDTTSAVTDADTSSMLTYSPEMDPEIVGAQFYRKLGDTLNIKFYEYTLKPGDSSALHFHPDHTYYLLQGGKLELTLQGTDTRLIELKPGTGGISGPLSDIVKNVGNTPIKFLITDIYRPRGK